MKTSLGRFVVLALAWSSLVAQGAGAAGVGGAAGPPETVAPGDTPSPDLVIGWPPPPMTPETRNGFLIRKAADYGVAAADYDGDRRADLSIKLDGGTWRIDYSANGFGQWDRTVLSYGGPAATPVPADYDGDRHADLAVKDRDGTWRIDYAANGFGHWDFQRGGYGTRETRGVPADYDGDRRADIAVKSDDGQWAIDYAADGFQGLSAWYYGYGGVDADPVPADYDGDRRADIAVKDDSGRWRIDYAADGFGTGIVSYSGYGGATLHAVPADYDGDRRADLAVKNDNGRWLIDYAANGFGRFDAASAGAGGVTARAVPADYDGDGRADRGVRVDCGSWYIDHATDSFGAWNRRFDHMAARDVVTATDVSRLAYTLASDFTGTIFIPYAPEMRLDGLRELPVKSCVSIIGTRQGLSEGALLSTGDKADKYTLFSVTGHDVRIQGVRLRGPSNGDRSSSQPLVTGISVYVDPALGLGGNVLIDNNEAWFWTNTAIYVEGQVHVNKPADVPPGARMTYAQAGLVRVTRNSFHHNSRESRGYGVNVSHGAYATIEGNLFDHNRHAIATHGDPYTGYVARYNYVLEGGYTECNWLGFCYWNQHFDVHGLDDHEDGYGGIGGERFDIASNTFRGEQEYYAESRAAFMLRGRPTVGAFFHSNVVVHDDREEAVRIKNSECWLPGYDFDDAARRCNLTIGPNLYNTDTTFGLAVGDFDSDRREDVFLANGTGWWYSSAGLTDWRFLRASTRRISGLVVGKFDADPRADVLYSTGSEWVFSSGGTAVPRVLRVGGASLTDCVFGDFDGNGLTDALQATGSTWYFSKDARSPWSLVISSPVRASRMRVGDFDGDGRDEVFDIENGDWSWWKLGWPFVFPLPLGLTTSVTGLVVGDFDGDGRDDIAQTSGDGWRFSRGARSAWAALRGSGGQPQYKDIEAVLIGRFGPDSRDDAIRYELKRTWNGYETGVRFVGWDGTQDAFVQWSPQHVYVR